MQTIKYEVDLPSMIDDIHGEGGDCLTLCPNGLSPKVASVLCRQCNHFVSWNKTEIVCQYPSTSDNNDCTASAFSLRPNRFQRFRIAADVVRNSSVKEY
jgi:hypothetical protein